jgi:hypothetical protein
VHTGLVLLVALLQGAAPQRPITTPRDLVEAMRARYDGKWYRTLTFVQNNTQYHAEVEFLVDGQRQVLEEYHDIQANVPMPDALWDARRWKTTRGKS